MCDSQSGCDRVIDDVSKLTQESRFKITKNLIKKNEIAGSEIFLYCILYIRLAQVSFQVW